MKTFEQWLLAEVKNCPNCGNVARDTANFCNRCSADLSQVHPEQIKQASYTPSDGTTVEPNSGQTTMGQFSPEMLQWLRAQGKRGQR